MPARAVQIMRRLAAAAIAVVGLSLLQNRYKLMTYAVFLTRLAN
jgi:hypothetical protein